MLHVEFMTNTEHIAGYMLLLMQIKLFVITVVFNTGTSAPGRRIVMQYMKTPILQNRAVRPVTPVASPHRKEKNKRGKKLLQIISSKVFPAPKTVLIKARIHPLVFYLSILGIITPHSHSGRHHSGE